MRPEKQLLLDEIKEKLQDCKALLVTRYQALNPNLSSDFRLFLGKSGGFFSIVRKRILIKAAEQEGLALRRADLHGHIGIVFVYNDPIQITKALYQYSKDHGQFLEVLGGKFEGRLYSSDEMLALSKLPSQDEMRAQFLGLLEAPMSQTLSVMEALLTSVLYCFDNKANK